MASRAAAQGSLVVAELSKIDHNFTFLHRIVQNSGGNVTPGPWPGDFAHSGHGFLQIGQQRIRSLAQLHAPAYRRAWLHRPGGWRRTAGDW